MQPAWNSNLTPKPAANPRAGGKLPVTCENLPAEISASLLRIFFFLQCVRNIHILQVPGIKQLKKVRFFAQKTKKMMLTFIARLFTCCSRKLKLNIEEGSIYSSLMGHKQYSLFTLHIQFLIA